MTHPQDLSLREQAAAVADGSLPAEELLDATLTRLAAADGPLNSTPERFPEEAEGMLRAAPPGPLHGVPVTVKDMFALPWRAAQNGTPVPLIPAAASGPFRRLRDAGAVVVGLANQHEMGLGTTGAVSAYGPIHNPWDLARSAGGSSSGSASAVAASLVAGSLGSDSGGSTRLPAAYCGVVGLKVTYRALPYDGYFGMGTTFSAPGVFGRDAGDARLLAAALLARPLPAGDARGLRVALVRDPYWTNLDPAADAACHDALRASGWTLRDVALEHAGLAGPAASARLLSEAAAPPPDLLARLSQQTRVMLLVSMLVPARYVPRADRVRAAVRRAVADAFATADVLAWPTSPAGAPPLDHPWLDLPGGRVAVDAANVRQASLANLCGVPGISIPVGRDGTGMPLGLQLLAPWGEEGRLLDAAEHLETVTSRAHVDVRPPAGAGAG
jgi:Asp-tRNA(Asn)/Glu-tRNA(Gln) amidotransferase A subunit family amidase